MMNEGTPQITVPIKPAWQSKVNWTQVVGFSVMALSYLFGHDVVTPEQQAAILTVIGLVQSVVTLILKTWFTMSVHPSSIS